MEIIERRTLLRPLRRWWWLIALATILAALSSAIYTWRQPEIYRSRATLIVGSTINDPNPNGGDIYLVQQLAVTYASMAYREPLQLATMAALGIDWLPNYSVYALPNSQIIEIQVFSEDATFSRDVAAAFAEQMILLGPAKNEEQERISFIDDQLAELQQGILDTRAEIREKRQALANLFSAREIADTQGLIQALEDKMSSLQANYAALLATTQRGSSNTIRVLEYANLPTAPVTSDLPMNLVLGALLGFALAAAEAI
ncbi:MAG: Wzz/FepE/Etk N-terminal domain-containing protein [Caldilineaceae bacterium]